MSNTLTEQVPGTFMSSLTRSNSKIRDDRALEIADVARLIYRRKIEDLEMKKTQMERERNNMLDLSPTSADSLVLASDFDADAFVAKDLTLGIDIRNIDIEINIAKGSYKNLFGAVTGEGVPSEAAPKEGGSE